MSGERSGRRVGWFRAGEVSGEVQCVFLRDFDRVTAELEARIVNLTAALVEIQKTAIAGNHGKLQAIGMRATASIALEADAKLTNQVKS